MGCFIDNPPEIRKVVTNIKVRDGRYEDLYLTIRYGARRKVDYIIHSDSRFTIDQVKKAIDGRSDFDDIRIDEYSERDYLFITIGEKESM